jgi:hypothetical protein
VHIDAELYPWLSAGAIAWGLLDCFLGYQIFKVTLTVFGGFLGGLAGHAAAVAMQLGPGGDIGGMVIGALLGGGLAFLLYLVAVFLAGFGFGYTLGVLLLANFNQMVAWLTGCVLGIVGGYAAVKLQRVVLVLATALLGAFRALLAMMYFTHKIDWLYYYQHPYQIPALIDGYAWLFPSILVLASAGAIAQFGLQFKSAKKEKKD